jgi:SAM-dependent methyltransferase
MHDTDAEPALLLSQDEIDDHLKNLFDACTRSESIDEAVHFARQYETNIPREIGFDFFEKNSDYIVPRAFVTSHDVEIAEIPKDMTPAYHLAMSRFAVDKLDISTTPESLIELNRKFINKIDPQDFLDNRSIEAVRKIPGFKAMETAANDIVGDLHVLEIGSGRVSFNAQRYAHDMAVFNRIKSITFVDPNLDLQEKRKVKAVFGAKVKVKMYRMTLSDYVLLEMQSGKFNGGFDFTEYRSEEIIDENGQISTQEGYIYNFPKLPRYNLLISYMAMHHVFAADPRAFGKMLDLLDENCRVVFTVPNRDLYVDPVFATRNHYEILDYNKEARRFKVYDKATQTFWDDPVIDWIGFAEFVFEYGFGMSYLHGPCIEAPFDLGALKNFFKSCSTTQVIIVLRRFERVVCHGVQYVKTSRLVPDKNNGMFDKFDFNSPGHADYESMSRVMQDPSRYTFSQKIDGELGILELSKNKIVVKTASSRVEIPSQGVADPNIVVHLQIELVKNDCYCDIVVVDLLKVTGVFDVSKFCFATRMQWIVENVRDIQLQKYVCGMMPFSNEGVVVQPLLAPKCLRSGKAKIGSPSKYIKILVTDAKMVVPMMDFTISRFTVLDDNSIKRRQQEISFSLDSSGVRMSLGRYRDDRDYSSLFKIPDVPFLFDDLQDYIQKSETRVPLELTGPYGQFNPSFSSVRFNTIVSYLVGCKDYDNFKQSMVAGSIMVNCNHRPGSKPGSCVFCRLHISVQMNKLSKCYVQPSVQGTRVAVRGVDSVKRKTLCEIHDHVPGTVLDCYDCKMNYYVGLKFVGDSTDYDVVEF